MRQGHDPPVHDERAKQAPRGHWEYVLDSNDDQSKNEIYSRVKEDMRDLSAAEAALREAGSLTDASTFAAAKRDYARKEEVQRSTTKIKERTPSTNEGTHYETLKLAQEALFKALKQVSVSLPDFTVRPRDQPDKSGAINAEIGRAHV